MATPIDIYVQIGSQELLAGRLWSHRRRGAESMTFVYDDAYLAAPDAYPLDPVQLRMSSGQQQTPVGREIFGALSDCAPDSWGRRLIQRQETKLAKTEGRTRRSFGEVDYLLGVRDDLRQGAVRFYEQDTQTFLATEATGIPALTSLPALLTAAEKMERGDETAEDLRLLTHAGSSLGGARPKAHVIGGRDQLAIAKFPSPKDAELDVIPWERVALELAQRAGINVPRHEIHRIGEKWVLVVDRFDRAGDRRIGYISALTMLGAQDGERGSYLDIADVISGQSLHASQDLAELWRRIAFGVLISNSDDHLRNHGFLRTSTAGWALSPAFDLNPDPSGAGELSTAIDFDDYTASIDLLFSVNDFFGLDRSRALVILSEVYSAIAQWRDTAYAMGLDKEIGRMKPAFEHRAAEEARALLATQG